jgi:hypothetical protein
LQKALTSYEERPVTIITKQRVDESLFIIRGKDQGLPAWHFVLVPISKVVELKAQQPSETIDITKFGRLIEYRDYRNRTLPTSGWGTDPPKMFHLWIEDQYS